jgi:hypothetical protein
MHIAHVWFGADDNITIHNDYNPHVAGARVLRSDAKSHISILVLKSLNVEAL